MAPRRSARTAARNATNSATNSVPATDQNIVNGPRVRKPTARYVEFQQSLKKSPKKQFKETNANAPEVDKFMIRLYAEIHAAAVEKITRTDRTAIHDLIRETRTLRFFDLFPTDVAGNLKQTLIDSRPSNNQGKEVVQQARNDLQVSHPERLVSFCKKPNLVILSICAHSQTFRTAIARSVADSKAEKEPLWRDIRSKIGKCASSLELFAKMRSLDWNSAINACNKDFEYLLSSVFQNDDNVADIDQNTFGIGDGDVEETHHPDNVPSYWVLPRKRIEAQRPQFQYDFTEALERHDFWGTAVPGNLNGASKPEIGDAQVALQVNVDECIVVPGYDWSHLPTEANGDPRFAGYKGYACQVCGKKAKATSTKTRSSTRPACSCTPGDLCLQQPLLELFDTGVFGVGVRALQTFKKGDYLGEYIGEIYPRKEQEWRYGGDEGCKYLFPCDIATKTATKKPDKFEVDPGIFGNWTRYINHSCDPNAEYFQTTVSQRIGNFICAIRDIGFGEDITSSYGQYYFQALKMTCRCGSDKCFHKDKQEDA
ncbi:hypothetical protein EDD37DRAFT_236829 [Exophiala viscosa]|uniref:uncharacterized protein n=1 Tax=Exophiala viscosa TaxID=2486360 RepID=UPI00219FEE75|nr:hypothetical protein EDD37DRAFT_236829 [Exophiala viscosa]